MSEPRPSKSKRPNESAFDALKETNWRGKGQLLLQSCGILRYLPKKYLAYTFEKITFIESNNMLPDYDRQNYLDLHARAEGKVEGETIPIALHIWIQIAGGENRFQRFLQYHDFVTKSARLDEGNRPYTLSLIIHTGFPKKTEYICNECVITKFGFCISHGTRKEPVEREIIEGVPNTSFIFMNVKQFVKLHLFKSSKLNELAKPLQQFLLMLGNFELFYLEYASEKSFEIDEILLPLADHLRKRYLEHCKKNNTLEPRKKLIFSGARGQAMLERLSKALRAGVSLPGLDEIYSLV
ncbi:uncharacterized protein LOC141857830 [Brevipalpus obovatus]|uniref:uncharacterized protein LOC141857830 n=1 Tax=Brevipalpus obovatus TaxID=246614 RepID=UPI003D9F33BF